MGAPPGVERALATLRHAQGRPRWFIGTPATWHVGVGTRRSLVADRLEDLVRAAEGLEDGPWFVAFAFDPTRTWPGFPAALLVQPERVWTDGGGEPEGEPAPTAAPQEPRIAVMDRRGWDRAFEGARQAIAAGGVRKVVLARAETLRRTDPVTLLGNLLAREGATTAFLFEPRPGLAFVGATPETLVAVRDGKLWTHALAGTEREGGASPPSAEHDLVVQDIVARLGAAGLSPSVGIRSRRMLRAVTHEETPIEAEVPARLSLLALAAALHPTPAVCGMPREASLELVRELERAPRGWYAGGVGWLDGGNGAVHVALRCALVGETTMAFAGAGIVAGSSADAEWRETEAKLRAIREAL